MNVWLKVVLAQLWVVNTELSSVGKGHQMAGEQNDWELKGKGVKKGNRIEKL